MTRPRFRIADLRAPAAGLLALVAGLLACTEDALVGPGPEGDQGAETVEIVVSTEQMASWRDTTYAGFALPLDAGFLLAADPQEASDLQARALLKYRTIPDSVTIDSVRMEIESYSSAELRLALDTAASRIPDDGFQVGLFGLERPFTATEATWQQAAEGEPWNSPGGDLAVGLGTADFRGASDSALAEPLVVPLPGVADSLLTAWRDANGDDGAALLVDGPGARLRFSRADLRFRVRPVGQDTTVELTVQPILSNDPSTFIYEPPLPPAGTALRLGGLPAHRAYMTFVPPESADGVRLLGATINRAELVFRPAAAPAPPFTLQDSVNAGAMQLISDPFEVGAKAPIGSSLTTQAGTALTPDSLAAGEPLRIAFTELMRRWAAAPDSFGDFRIGLRLQPDAQTLNYWEFGSAQAPEALRPFLRLVVTPPSDFDVP